MSQKIRIITTYKSGRIDVKESKLNSRCFLTKKDQAYVDDAKKLPTVENVKIERD